MWVTVHLTSSHAPYPPSYKGPISVENPMGFIALHFMQLLYLACAQKREADTGMIP